MAVSWNTRELPPEQDLRAMALLRISDEGLSEDEWRDEIRKYRQACEAEAGGLASIEDKQQYVLGLCFYDIRDDVRCGKVLEIRRAVIPDTVAPLIAQDFVLIIENLARTRNCGSIHVSEDVGHRFQANAMQSLLESEFSFVSPHWCHKISSEASVV